MDINKHARARTYTYAHVLYDIFHMNDALQSGTQVTNENQAAPPPLKPRYKQPVTSHVITDEGSYDADMTMPAVKV